ncbi:MAG: DUF1385 domain-containing protein [Chloroflexota bacterium]|nr:MAG: DUF1385 domain-containing protein [Chloroflexota bacterium]
MPESFTKSNFSYGGQAVIEGVMMRGSKSLAVAVRNPKDEIIIHTEPLDPRIYGGRLARIPFVRGLTLLWDALGLGIKSLMFSAEVALEEEKEEGADKVFEGPVQWATILLSLSFSVALFFVLPAFVGGQIEKMLGLDRAHLVSNIIEGLLRLLLLIGYIWLIGRLPDIKRLYGYHGAEHKTINAYEAGSELTPESVAKHSLQHPRCGTAFLLTVVIISILFFSLLPPMSIPVRVLSRIVFLPVVAGIAYEVIRFTARHQDKAVIRAITKPNLALQRLTTREPDEGMLAVAIAAFKEVLASEVEQPAEQPVAMTEVQAAD